MISSIYKNLSILVTYIGFTIGVCISQPLDTVTIYHKYYSTTFSKSKHFPVVVKYWLTKAMLDCEHRYKRSNKFKPDPSIPEYTNLNKDYKKSGYDRGHQMDAYDCGCDSIAMAESFYYSNVAPQVPTLNRGNWKSNRPRLLLENNLHQEIRYRQSVFI